MWKNYIKVTSYEDAASILHESQPSARIVGGGTDLILEIKNGLKTEVKKLIDISDVRGSAEIFEKDGTIYLGPMATHALACNSDLLKQKSPPLVEACWSVGSPQIRNMGTIAGNLITASPANDTIAPLLALGAKLELLSVRGQREVFLKGFYTGLRETTIEGDEIVTGISFPAMDEFMRGCFLKIGLRKTLACSVVSTAVILRERSKFGDRRGTIEKASITLGSAAPRVIHARKVEEYIRNRNLDEEIIEKAGKLAAENSSPVGDIRASAEYRMEMVSCIVRRALLHLYNGTEKTLLPEKPIFLNTWEGPGHAGDAEDHAAREIGENDAISITINGEKKSFPQGRNETLIRFLRNAAHLYGAKESCGEGECGSCTVLLNGKAVLSCLTPAAAADGGEVKTIESLASGDKLHPLQQAFIDEGAVQCGYCTPGFIMASYKLLEENNNPSREEIVTAISGNVCRCTGYYKIVRAIENASIMMNKSRSSSEGE